MATLYNDKWTEGTKSTFIRRVSIALDQAAFTLLASGFDADPVLRRRQQRLVKLILNDPLGAAQPVSLTIVSNSGIDDSSTDTQIQSAINANLNNLTWLVDDEAS